MDNLEPVASRKEEKEARRAERLAREPKEMEEAHRRRVYSIVVGGVLAIAAIAAVIVAVAAGGGSGHTDTAGDLPAPKQEFAGGVDPPPQQVTDLDPAAKAAGCVLKNPVIEGRTHIPPETKVTYKTNPPTSGNHDPQPADDGVYSRPMTALETRHFIHTLEHGRIELQYRPTLARRWVDRLGGLFNEDPYHLVLLPNRKMPYQVAASAWGHLIGCEKVSDATFDALRAFRDRYRDQGPEQVP